MTEEDTASVSNDEMEQMMEDAEPTEREVIMVPFQLDPAHRRMDLALREQGIDVQEILAQESAPALEQKLYEVLQQVKYAAE